MYSTINLNSKVFYPSHGVGTVVGQKNIDFAGESQQYYEFEFFSKDLTIATPVRNLEKLGVRPVLDLDEIKRKIKTLKQTFIKDPKVTDYNELITKIEKLNLEGEVDSFVEIIQLCHHEMQNREKDERLVPISITKHLRNSINHIVNEMALSSGMAIEECGKLFTTVTGLALR